MFELACRVGFFVSGAGLEREQLDQIIRITDEVVRDEGLECIEAEFVKGDRTLRLFVDWIDLDNGAEAVNLDQCIKVNHVLDDDGRLDELMTSAYTLEVSSPGVERPLRFARHFSQHVGQRIHVRLKEKLDGKRQVLGTLLRVESPEEQLIIDADDGLLTVPLASLHKANLVFDWAAV